LASGIEMMMKAMGVNPDALKEQAQAVQATVKDFKEQLNRIEEKLDRIIENGKDNGSDQASNASEGNQA
jgi:predicted  nucleic acid-binding Zn-ribbon protein